MKLFLFFLLQILSLCFGCTYTVVTDDTLDSIASQFPPCNATELASLNGITDINLIQSGQLLQIPAQCCPNLTLVTTEVYQNCGPLNNGPISEATLAECLPEFYINFTGTAAPYCNVHSPSSMVAPLNSVMAEFSINSSYRIAAFISQIGLESADLRCWEENPYWTGMCWNITDNCCYAGGCEYKGRGPIQLTNDFNYQACQNYINSAFQTTYDLLTYPDLVKTDMQVGFRCTAWFWTARGLVNGQYENLNIQADLAQTDCFAYSRITQAILGTCNQITQTARVNYYCLARKALGIDAPNTPCGYANFPCIGDPNYPTCTPMPASCSTTQQQITTEQVSAQNVNNQVTAATSSNTTAIAVSVVFVILFLAALVAGLIVGYRIFKKRRAAKQQITSGFIEIQTIPNSPPMTESSPISPELPRLESITSSDKLLPSPPVHKPVPTKISKPLPNPPSVVPISSPKPLPNPPSVVPISSPKPPLPAVPLNSPKPPINRNAPKFPIDAQVFAKYSGDGKYYRAVVKQYVQGKYEVAYIDFNNDKEWLTEDCLKN